MLGIDIGKILVAPLGNEMRLRNHRKPVVRDLLDQMIGRDRSMFDPVAGPHACFFQSGERED